MYFNEMKPTLKQTHFYVLMCLKGSNILGNQGLRSKYTSHSHATRCVWRGLSFLACLGWTDADVYVTPCLVCPLQQVRSIKHDSPYHDFRRTHIHVYKRILGSLYANYWYRIHIYVTPCPLRVLSGSCPLRSHFQEDSFTSFLVKQN